MNLIHKLDAGGHVHNRHQLEEILNQINAELPDIELEGSCWALSASAI
ncbi:hypothetical protein [Allobaculum sp. Allo2]|nr:hypothetical protein [Allobaculum sp. Allo2]UNT93706.1 hypothetical protein KWG61_02845 [Allobaculum sp. Allo2]